MICLGYARVLSRDFEMENNALPTEYIVKLLLKHPPLIHVALVGSGVFFFVFAFNLVFIWLTQTGNLFLGRTTYERFSNLHTKANKFTVEENVSEHIDHIHPQNCSFMCCTRQLTDQAVLKDYQAKRWIKGSTSSTVCLSIFELNATTYQKTISNYQKHSGDEANTE